MEVRLGDELRALRVARGDSLRVVARAVRATASHLSLVERGEGWPKRRLVSRLAAYFGKPVEAWVIRAERERLLARERRLAAQRRALDQVGP